MIEKAIRIDGNPEYEYAKCYVTLIDDDLYYKTSTVGDYGVVDTLMKVNKNLIRMKKTEGCEEQAQLLDIIRHRDSKWDRDENWNKLCNVNYAIVKAIKVCDITYEDQINVGGIEGLTVTYW